MVPEHFADQYRTLDCARTYLDASLNLLFFVPFDRSQLRMAPIQRPNSFLHPQQPEHIALGPRFGPAMTTNCGYWGIESTQDCLDWAYVELLWLVDSALDSAVRGLLPRLKHAGWEKSTEGIEATLDMARARGFLP